MRFNFIKEELLYFFAGCLGWVNFDIGRSWLLGTNMDQIKDNNENRSRDYLRRFKIMEKKKILKTFLRGVRSKSSSCETIKLGSNVFEKTVGILFVEVFSGN